MPSDQLKSTARSFRDWATRQALPFWSTAGFDAEHDRFEERVTLAGKRIPGVPIRLMTQARQIYSFGLADRRGWHRDASGIVERAYEAMIRDFHRRDGNEGWIFSIHRDGTIADTKRDLYAHAFVLLAIASYVEATGRRDALALADATLAYIDGHLRAAEGGGYVDSAPPADDLRRQNPHMHLLEGLLSLWSSSADQRYLDRAAEIFGLFSSRFFRPEVGALGEYFNASLEPASGAAGNIVEPGHHYEWIWLLRWFERESGQSVQRYVDALYAHASSYGYDAAGLIVDELLLDGSVRTPSHRAWPLTEAIKANLAEGALGRTGAQEKAITLVGLLRDRFLTREPAGGWIDRLDKHGKCATDFMPASTLYHLLCALGELDRFSQALQAPGVRP